MVLRKMRREYFGIRTDRPTDSPIPSSRRNANRITKLPARPVAAVAADHSRKADGIDPTDVEAVEQQSDDAE